MSVFIKAVSRSSLHAVAYIIGATISYLLYLRGHEFLATQMATIICAYVPVLVEHIKQIRQETTDPAGLKPPSPATPAKVDSPPWPSGHLLVKPPPPTRGGRDRPIRLGRVGPVLVAGLVVLLVIYVSLWLLVSHVFSTD